jgi:hypothetical protein
MEGVRQQGPGFSRRPSPIGRSDHSFAGAGAGSTSTASASTKPCATSSARKGPEIAAFVPAAVVLSLRVSNGHPS